MSVELSDLRQQITPQQIIDLLARYGNSQYDERENHIIFPTICHNPIGTEASMKLYYYKDSYTFHCYTECGESFDIFELIRRIKSLNKLGDCGEDFYTIVLEIANFINYNVHQQYAGEYISEIDIYEDNDNRIQLKEYDKNVLDVFRWYPTPEWLNEGISEETMRKYNILYYDYHNKIIIPHYDIDDRLIGIRARTLDEEEAAKYGKYGPVRVQDTMYRHSLSLNLYGINKNKNDIKDLKTAIIFEGEKSILKYNDLYDYNISVASCGSSLNLKQLHILVKQLNVQNVILAYDKEFTDFNTQDATTYYQKLKRICDKYKNYCNFYFLYDFHNLLDLKDSPIDKGKEVFEQLLKDRIEVR